MAWTALNPRWTDWREKRVWLVGASSGIGLATARMAAERGARVLLAARSEEVLAKVAAELGRKSAYVVADVGRREDVQAISDKAMSTFGGFDTWVNNAGVSIRRLTPCTKLAASCPSTTR